MPTNNLRIRKGEQYSIHVTVRDEDDALVDLTGETCWFTVKESKTTLDAAAILQKTVGSGITLANQVTDMGELDVKILSTDFVTDLASAAVTLDRDYFYDLKVKLSSNDEFVVIEDTLELLSPVTLST